MYLYDCSFYLSSYIYVPLFAYWSILLHVYLYVYPYPYLSIYTIEKKTHCYQTYLYLFNSISIYLYQSIPIYESIYVSIYPSFHLSICLSIYLSMFLKLQSNGFPLIPHDFPIRGKNHKKKTWPGLSSLAEGSFTMQEQHAISWIFTMAFSIDAERKIV